MTVPIVPGAPTPQLQPYSFPIPPPPKRSGFPSTIQTWIVVVAALPMVAVAFAVGAVVGAIGQDSLDTTTGPTAAHTTTPAPVVEHYPDLTVADLQIALVVTSKQCFGSAGCNVEVEPDLTLTTGRAFEPGSRWAIIFDIAGGEDPYTGTIEATVGDDAVHYTYDSLILVPTARSSDVLTATVTSVRRRG